MMRPAISRAEANSYFVEDANPLAADLDRPAAVEVAGLAAEQFDLDLGAAVLGEKRLGGCETHCC